MEAKLGLLGAGDDISYRKSLITFYTKNNCYCNVKERDDIKITLLIL